MLKGERGAGSVYAQGGAPSPLIGVVGVLLGQGGTLLKNVKCLVTAEKLKLYQIPVQSLVHEEEQWVPGPRSVALAFLPEPIK